MIVKVMFEGKKPEVRGGLRVGKNGKVRKGVWRKLIIGHRYPDVKEIKLEPDEILMDMDFAQERFTNDLLFGLPITNEEMTKAKIVSI